VIVIHLLGTPWVEVEGEKMQGIHGLKLACLMGIFHPESISRERALGALWPDSPRSVGSANLRAALSRLRSSLPGNVLVASREGRLQFVQGLVTTDTIQLRALSEAFLDGLPADFEGNRTLSSLIQSLTREPLEGNGEAWAEEFRFEWRLEAADLLARLALTLESLGRLDEALEACRAGIANDPLEPRLNELRKRLPKLLRERRLGLSQAFGRNLDRTLGAMVMRLLENDKPAAQELLAAGPFREELTRNPQIFLKLYLQAVMGSDLQTLAAQRCAARAACAASLLGRTRLAVEWGEKVLKTASHLPLRKATLIIIAFDYWSLGQRDRAWEAVEEAIEACQTLGDTHDGAIALGQRAALYLRSGQGQRAEDGFEEALEVLLKEPVDKAGRDAAVLLGNHGLAALMLGKEDVAWSRLKLSESRFAELGARVDPAFLAPMAWLSGPRHGRQEACRRMSLALREVGERASGGVAAVALAWCSLLLQDLGRDDEACMASALALRLFRREGPLHMSFPEHLRDRLARVAAQPRSDLLGSEPLPGLIAILCGSLEEEAEVGPL
jgi:tetratricopeptide (TPR) repeat protein